MLRDPRVCLLVCMVLSVGLDLSGCAKGCPNGSGLLNGRCVPVQQVAGSGGTDTEQPSETASGSAGQTTSAASPRAPDASVATSTRVDPSSAAAGNGARAGQPKAQAAVDAGSPATGPVAAGCSPSEELCDNMDNDCDGKIDEQVTMACQDLPAPCQAGVLSCHAGKWDDEATQCVGAVGPTDEVCDEAMTDENCNGTANEGCACNENDTQPCGRSDGVCKQGMQRCMNGMWTVECEGAVGNPDEGCECLSGASEMCNAGRGVCMMGERQCEKGMWTPCKSLEKASTELCDNLDNDCNGIVDGPTAKCDNPGEKCVAPGRCAECTIDADCGKMTTGCQVGKCKSGSCNAEPLAEYAMCTSGGTRGYCVDNKCSPPQMSTIQDGDIGSGEGQVTYNGAWSLAGDVHYSNATGASFLAHFVGTTAVVAVGQGPDRGKVEYSICNANGSGCSGSKTIDNWATQISGAHRVWTSPTVTFGEHTVKGRLVGQRTEATDQIIDLDFIEVK